MNSFRDEVVDLVALRARLEARMEARLKGEDWTGLEVGIKEFGRLTPRGEYAKRLSQLKDDALRQQEAAKTSILTKTAQGQITDLQAMIDRYLDDEPIKAYIEALERSRTDADVKEKALRQGDRQEVCCHSEPCSRGNEGRQALRRDQRALPRANPPNPPVDLRHCPFERFVAGLACLLTRLRQGRGCR